MCSRSLQHFSSLESMSANGKTICAMSMRAGGFLLCDCVAVPSNSYIIKIENKAKEKNILQNA